MAVGKKSFVLYADQRGVFEKLNDEQAGNLIKHIFAYVNDENPEGEFVTELAFESIKQQLKRDLNKWDKTREGRSKAGKASAEARRVKKEQEGTNSTNVKSVQQSSTNPTVNDNVNVTVNVNDIEDNSINFEKLLSFINDKTSRKFRTINKTAQQKYKARLKDGYTKEDIINAVSNACDSSYHKEKNYQYLTPEFFSRADTLDKYSTVKEIEEEKPKFNPYG